MTACLFSLVVTTASGIGRRLRLVLLGLSLSLVGCASLQPESLPEEVAAAPAGSELWRQVQENRESSWFWPLNVGPEALEWRLRAIASASQSIDLQTFLWRDDEVGATLAQALMAAADRGVRVRLLLDDSFTMGESGFLASMDSRPGIQTRIYNPFRYRPDNVALRQLFNLGEFSRIDRRMHNKVLVVDNVAAIVGGRNLASEYFGYHETSNFRDMEVLAVGEVSQRISLSFDSYWNSGWAFPLGELNFAVVSASGSDAVNVAPADELASGESAAALYRAWSAVAAMAFPGEVQLLADLPAAENPAREPSDRLARQMLATLDRAEREIIAVSAYLIPTPELEQAIERAVKRGVRVKVLTNSLRSNNHTAAHAAYRHHIARLLELGVQVYELRSVSAGMGLYMRGQAGGKKLGLHAKFMLIDSDLSFIGSANFDPRSLNLNTEMGLLVRSADLNEKLRGFLEHDFDSANAWHLQTTREGAITWVGDDVTLREQPSDSIVQRLEDWFLGVLPIDSEM